MLLINYYKCFGAYINGKNANVKNMNGYDVAVSNANCASVLRIGSVCLTQLSPDDNNWGIVFGDGDSPVSLEDVKLSGNRIAGLSGNIATSYKESEDGYTVTALCTITNANDAPVTIKEVGCVGGSAQSIIERTLLETPVTIPAGGVGQVTYTIRMNYPTA